MADGQQGSANSHESDEHSPPPIGSKNIREQDRLLPIANISRIMKKAIPPNGKIAKDAKDAVQECVSEFISFITSEASDKCQRERRKTINGYDLLLAMLALGFEDYIDPLKMFLDRYTEPDLLGQLSHLLGDMKRLTKAADGSIEREGMLPTPTSQLAHQGSFSQGMGYGISQGDMKGSTKAFDGFVKREGMQPSPNSQLANQVSFYQGLSYGISQVDTKGLAKAVDGSVKRERMQPCPNSELADQSLFSQGISYGISQGDAKKGTAKATNVSVKTEGVQARSHTSQLAHQGSVSQGMSHGISQVKREGEDIFH